MTLYSHSLYEMTLLDNNILNHKWTEKTKDMTFEDFQEAVQNHAGYVIEYRSQNVLIDTRNFKFTLTEEHNAWAVKENFPRYYKVETKKMAFVMPAEVLQYTKDVPAKDGKFAMKYFSDYDKALAWLSE